jgi:hypothetical protein
METETIQVRAREALAFRFGGFRLFNGVAGVERPPRSAARNRMRASDLPYFSVSFDMDRPVRDRVNSRVVAFSWLQVWKQWA